jgi:histidinol-phosphate aminotransferase
MEIPIPDYIRSLRPYVPGKPIEETRREYHLKKIVKLASNENPLGPSPKALLAIRKATKELHRYPDANGFALKQALSKKLKVPAERIALGNGSNELIDLLIVSTCIPGDAIVTSQAAFVAYKVCAQVHGVRTLEAPLTSDLRFDLQKMLELVKFDGRVKLVFIANPNNPTGTYVNTTELRAFLKELQKVRDGSVQCVLDYAYWEYVTAKDLPDAIELAREFPNVVAMRTFSKVYGLAGTRVGYWVASKDITQTIDKIREPFNMNALGMAAAEAALGDTAFVQRARKNNAIGMKFWEKTLKKLEIPYWPSQGNFLLIDVQRGLGLTGAEVFELGLQSGVILRPVTNYGLAHALRVSIGTPAENEFAAKFLSRLAREKSPKRVQ